MPAGGWGSGAAGAATGAMGWQMPGNTGSAIGSIPQMMQKATGRAMGGGAGMGSGAGMAGPALGNALMAARRQRGPGMAEGGDPVSFAGAAGYPGSPSGPGLEGGTDRYLSRAPYFRKMGAPERMPREGMRGAESGAASRESHDADLVMAIARELQRSPFMMMPTMTARGSYPPMHGADMPVTPGQHVQPSPYNYEMTPGDQAYDAMLDAPGQAIHSIREDPIGSAANVADFISAGRMGVHLPEVKGLPIPSETVEKMRKASDFSDPFDRAGEQNKQAREALGRKKEDEERTEWARRTRQIPMSEKRGGKVRYTKVKAHKRRLGGNIKKALNVAKRRKKA